MQSDRQTIIFIADEGGLFPANFIFPADDLFPEDANAREITNIVAGSLKLDSLIAEKTPQFGQMFATKFECQIYLEDDLSGKFISVYHRNGNVARSMFLGKIDSCKTDRVGTDRTLIAYDYAYSKGQINIASWWDRFWEVRETATLKQVRDNLLEYMGLYYEDVVLPNDTLIVKKNVAFSACTFQQMLKMICELNCCFPHFSGGGELEFIILNTEAEPTNLDGKYEWTNTTFQEYETAEIDGVQFFDSDEQLKWTVGQSENAYPVSKNIFLYDLSDDPVEEQNILNSIGNTMLDYLSDLHYNPASVKMIVSDIEISLGDYLEAEGHQFYAFSISLSGSQFIEQTIKADGDEQLYSGVAHLDYGELVLNEKIARVKYDLDEFLIEYGETMDGETGVFARLTINEQAITQEVANRTKADGKALSNYQENYVPTASNYPANGWITDVQKANHEYEIFYNETTGKFYEWTKISDVWQWHETTNVGYNRTHSLFEITSESISTEISDRKQAISDEVTNRNTAIGTAINGEVNNRNLAITQAIQGEAQDRNTAISTAINDEVNDRNTAISGAVGAEATARENADAQAFANYVGTVVPTTSNTPANTWTTDELKKANVGVIYYNTTNKKYYKWTENTSVEPVTYSWTEQSINKTYDLVLSSADSRIKQTADSLAFEIATERYERTDSDIKAFANYFGEYVPTNSNSPASTWETSTEKESHVGEVFYNTDNKKYYEYQKTGTNTYAWVVQTINSTFDLVTRSASHQIEITDDKLSSEISTLEQTTQLMFANYTGTVTPTASNYPASSWNTDTLRKQHVGEVYYDTVTKKYYQWYVTLNSTTGAVTAYGWEEHTGSQYDLVTTTANSKLEQTKNSFEIALSTETKARQDADLASTYNYTGSATPTNSNTPASDWTTDEIKKTHVGEVYYKPGNPGTYYIYTETSGVYGWTQVNASTPFDLVTKSRSSRIAMTDEEISSEVTRATAAEKGIFANYTGDYVPTLSNYPASGWDTSNLIKYHEGDTFYNTDTEQYYRWVVEEVV